MQAVILASGRGTRMRELTERLPKPMLPVSGKSLIEHKLRELPEGVSEIIIVIGYLGEVITAAFGAAWSGIPIRYVEQETLDGSAGAVWRCAPYVADRFVVLMGDDLYCREDIERVIAEAGTGWSVLVQDVAEMSEGGSMVRDGEGRVIAIEEGDHRGRAGSMNTNLFCLDRRVFGFSMVPKAPGSHEFGLPQSVVKASEESGIPLATASATFWFQVTAPEDLDRAALALAAR